MKARNWFLRLTCQLKNLSFAFISFTRESVLRDCTPADVNLHSYSCRSHSTCLDGDRHSNITGDTSSPSYFFLAQCDATVVMARSCTTASFRTALSSDKLDCIEGGTVSPSGVVESRRPVKSLERGLYSCSIGLNLLW